MRSAFVKAGPVVCWGLGLGWAWGGGELKAASAERIRSEMGPDTPNALAKQGSTWNANWDFREPWTLAGEAELSDASRAGTAAYDALVRSKTPTATRHILLVRHGQYNLEGKTDAENGLTRTGREQAHATGRRLKDLGFHFEHIVVSTQKRAMETAEALRSELDVAQVGKVREEPMIVEGFPWAADPSVHAVGRAPKEEVMRESSRIEAAFRRYFHRAPVSQVKDSFVLLVCHGNVSRYFLCRALQLPPQAWMRLTMAHGSVTHVAIQPNGHVSLKAFADGGHLPPSLITYQ